MLGSYVIPTGDDTKKDGYKGIKGDASFGKAKGLQSDFAKACKSFVTALKSAGCAVSIGTYGHMTRKTAKAVSTTGNNTYLRNIDYYQNGLALDVTINVTSSVSYSSGGNKYVGNDAVNAIADDAGLALLGNNVRVVPKDVSGNTSATDIKYEESKKDGSDKSGLKDASGNDKGAIAASGDTTIGGTNSSSTANASVASVAFFFSNQYSSYEAQAKSSLLAGNRALANDTTVMRYVKTAAETSLRTFSSGPNGEFIAWYPDYWGAYGNSTPYLELDSIELLDLTIEQNESSFYSHVYCTGVQSSGAPMDETNTQGVVSIESDVVALASAASGITGDESDYVVSDEVSAVIKNLIHIPEGEEWRYTPKELYRRYGARPFKASNVMAIEGNDATTFETNPQYILPFLQALFTFMEKWSEQNKCTLKITFMPELFPGCRIKLKDFDVSMYVKQVNHSMDYSTGFTTSVTCTCPIGTLVRGMVNPNYSAKNVASNNNVQKNSPIVSTASKKKPTGRNG